jgi:hypothetical protein
MADKLNEFSIDDGNRCEITSKDPNSPELPVRCKNSGDTTCCNMTRCRMHHLDHMNMFHAFDSHPCTERIPGARAGAENNRCANPGHSLHCGQLRCEGHHALHMRSIHGTHYASSQNPVEQAVRNTSGDPTKWQTAFGLLQKAVKRQAEILMQLSDIRPNVQPPDIHSEVGALMQEPDAMSWEEFDAYLLALIEHAPLNAYDRELIIGNCSVTFKKL